MGASYWESCFICFRWQRGSLLTLLVDYFIASKAATQQNKKSALQWDSIPTVIRVASWADVTTDKFMKFFKETQKSHSTETYFNPEGPVILEEVHEVFGWFGLVDDQFCFWENPSCVIHGMSMNDLMMEVTRKNIFPSVAFIY